MGLFLMLILNFRDSTNMFPNVSNSLSPLLHMLGDNIHKLNSPTIAIKSCFQKSQKEVYLQLRKEIES